MAQQHSKTPNKLKFHFSVARPPSSHAVAPREREPKLYQYTVGISVWPQNEPNTNSGGIGGVAATLLCDTNPILKIENIR